jgi:hypothetical protein
VPIQSTYTVVVLQTLLVVMARSEGGDTARCLRPWLPDGQSGDNGEVRIVRGQVCQCQCLHYSGNERIVGEQAIGT